MRTITRKEVNEMYKYAKGSLYSAYDCPSSTKRAIWNDIIHRDGYDFTVRSRNCFMFTVMYKTYDGHLVIVFPTREEVYEITD